MSFNYYFISGLINGLTCLALGLFIYVKNFRNIVNRSFALFCLSMVVWSFGYCLWPVAADKAGTLLGFRILHVGAIFIPVFYLQFVASWLGLLEKKKKLIVLGYVIAVLLTPFVFTTLYIKDMVPKFAFKYWAQPGILYHFYLLYFFTYAIYPCYLMFKAYPKISGYKRNQIKYILLGTIIGYLGGATNYPLWYDIPIYPFGNIFISIYVILVSYSIVKYRLLDINIVITRGIAYGGVVAVIASVYLGLEFGLDRIFSGVLGYNPALAHSLLFLVVLSVLIFVLPQMRTKALDMVRDRIFRGKYDYQKELVEASKEISAILNLPDLSHYVIEKLKDVFHVSKMAMLVLDESSRQYVVVVQQGLYKELRNLKLSPESPLVKMLKSSNSIVIHEEVSDPTLKEKCASIGVELCVPLMVKDILVGMVFLGEKRGGHMYTHEDIDLLTALASQLALTLEYIRSIERISDEKRYVGLGKASMRMAHDIKNPLVPIKTFLQLLPEKYPEEYKKMGEIDAEFTGHFYESALNGVERIDLLIQRALHYARHPEPIFSKVNLCKVIDDALTQEEVDIRDNKVKLAKNYFSADATLDADADQLMELFSNLISNSVDAMQETKTRNLTITTKSRNHDVIIAVSDTGCGIPKDRLSTLFDPFITYKHKGSGLGLAIVRKIAEDHNGKVEISSVENKGTTVTITLPKKAITKSG